MGGGASTSPPIILCLLQITPENLQTPIPADPLPFPGLIERLALLNEGLATICIRGRLFRGEQLGARGPRAGLGATGSEDILVFFGREVD